MAIEEGMLKPSCLTDRQIERQPTNNLSRRASTSLTLLTRELLASKLLIMLKMRLPITLIQ